MITKNFTLKLVKVNMFSLVMSLSIMLTKFIKKKLMLTKLQGKGMASLMVAFSILAFF